MVDLADFPAFLDKGNIVPIVMYTLLLGSKRVIHFSSISPAFCGRTSNAITVFAILESQRYAGFLRGVG